MAYNSFDLVLPKDRRTSVIFASPHSGRDYAWSFLRRTVLDERTIRSSEDAFVDMLFSTAPAHGAPLLSARSPRAYVDLNRAAEELDPALIQDIEKSGHNPRIGSGLGVIPRVVSNGRAIYRGKITRREAEARLAEVWHPYHSALARLVAESQAAFGQAILIDCHSMPHEAVDSFAQSGLKRPDVVLGDRFGASASAAIVDRIEEAFSRAGLRVARNTPFAGAYTTQNYGRPSRNQHVVQVEIDRALYMNEHMIRPNGNFAGFSARLNTVIEEVVAIGRPNREQLAAE